MAGYVLSVNKTAASNQPYPRVSEGSSFTVTIRNQDITAEKEIDFEISGLSAADFSSSGPSLVVDDNPSYTGIFYGTFNLNYVSGYISGVESPENFYEYIEDTITITLSNDLKSEGNERFKLELVNDRTKQIIVDISDTSFPTPSEVDPGSSLVAEKRELRTEYFDNGNFTIDVAVSGTAYAGVSSLPWIIHGPAAQYITPSSGTLSLSGSAGSITFTKNIPSDDRVGDFYFELQFDNKNSAIEFPIFRERAPVTYELIVNQPVIVNAAADRSVTFTLITTGLDEGTAIGYTCYGDTDDVNGTTSGNFTLDANGTDSVTLTHKTGGVGDTYDYNKTGTVILRLDNGQAKARVTLRETTSSEIVDGMAQVAAVLDNINNNMIQNNAKMQILLQSIANQLMDIREDLQTGSAIDTLARLAEGEGIRTNSGYGELLNAAAFKSLILEGGILRKNDNTLTDADVKDLIEAIRQKPDQELKAESLKYMNDILGQLRSALG